MQILSGIRSVWRASVPALAITLLVAGCNTDRTITGSVPHDFRDRHPIRLAEAERSVQLLVGSGRGDLTADQRAQVSAVASAWRREGTGYLIVDVPSGTPNERAADYAAKEVQSLLRASGVPERAIHRRHYEPPSGGEFGPIRLAYTRVEAQAGPCGEWPEDLGVRPYPSRGILPSQWENRPYWNFGCATQQNLAAAVSNPQDLVQPRAEDPPYAARRQSVIEKYRKGENPSGAYDTDTAGISNVGQ
jgi:pilus assembly protein CpaD